MKIGNGNQGNREWKEWRYGTRAGSLIVGQDQSNVHTTTNSHIG